jgi:hypothetical protein
MYTKLLINTTNQRVAMSFMPRNLMAGRNLSLFNLITVGDLHLSIFFFAFPFIFLSFSYTGLWSSIFISFLIQILKDEIIKLVVLVLVIQEVWCRKSWTKKHYFLFVTWLLLLYAFAWENLWLRKIETTKHIITVIITNI